MIEIIFLNDFHLVNLLKFIHSLFLKWGGRRGQIKPPRNYTCV